MKKTFFEQVYFLEQSLVAKDFDLAKNEQLGAK
jgi:hypothetical protein